ncbi:MAG: ribosome maturation factor RimM [Dehalococcoidia bacterium]
MPEPRDGYTAVGRVVRAHGLVGELRVVAFAEGAPNLQPGRQVWVAGVPLRVLRLRPTGDAWILESDRIRSRTMAEAFREQLVEVPDAEVRRASADSYFVHELIGLRVVTADGEELGELVEVMQPGANDVYVVRGPRGDVLIPAIADVVTVIDLPVGVMTITPLPGLLDGSQ